MRVLTLKDNRKVELRNLMPADNRLLFRYLSSLSVESKSRFGPHSFDEETINGICAQLPGRIKRYVAMDLENGEIVGYMLLHPGLLAFDEERFKQSGKIFDHSVTMTFAPSIADAWQSSGLGSAMYGEIEEELSRDGITHIVLWGGVQATNAKAIAFYKKLGFEFGTSFRHDGKDNHDMFKRL